MSELKKGDPIRSHGKNGVVTGFASDDPLVPWVKLEDGMTWDARDLGYLTLRCTKEKPAKIEGAYHEESEVLAQASKGTKRELRKCASCGIEFYRAVEMD